MSVVRRGNTGTEGIRWYMLKIEEEFSTECDSKYPQRPFDFSTIGEKVARLFSYRYSRLAVKRGYSSAKGFGSTYKRAQGNFVS
jgi:hypothetical protein